jgi:hypothetical protein
MADNRDGPTRGVADNVTRPMGGGGQGGGGQYVQTPSDRTQIVGGGKTPGQMTGFDPMRDPVVGWLVIVEGVGKGMAIPLGYGQNSVGRGENARRRLCFGVNVYYEGATQHINVKGVELNEDPQVSRVHFIVTYDGRARRFHIQQSPESTNLTYLKGGENGEEPILSPRELKAFDRIQAGATELMFIPLCHRNPDGTGFDWQG